MKEPYSAYLFAYVTGNEKVEEAIRFALSADGYHYTALNGDRPIISSAAISRTGGVRDPHILCGAHGKTFYMAATDMVSAKGWNANQKLVAALLALAPKTFSHLRGRKPAAAGEIYAQVG